MAQMISWGGQDNLKKGQLRLAQQYADAGMMARAQAAFTRAGGVWSNAIHRLFKTEAAATSRYGGDIGFKWADYGVRTQAQLDQIIVWAKDRKFGQIKNLINSLGGTKQWNKQLHTKLSAEYHGKQEADTDATTPGWQGTRTTEFKRDAPEVAPALYDTTTTAQGVDDTWRQQFQGGISEGNIGAWGLDASGNPVASQARKDAQRWRNLHMGAAEREFGVTRSGADQRVDVGSGTGWTDYINKRNKIASRHRKMLGAGNITLGSGAVIGYTGGADVTGQ